MLVSLRLKLNAGGNRGVPPGRDPVDAVPRSAPSNAWAPFGTMTAGGVGHVLSVCFGSLTRRCSHLLRLPAVALANRAPRRLMVDVTDGPVRLAAEPAMPRSTGSGRLRIASCGDLGPHTAVADLLLCAVGWAERHPACALQISWIGDGDLRGVLAAQPLPANLTQRFCGSTAPDTLANELAGIDLLLIPGRGPIPVLPLDIAIAAGTPVIGCVQNDNVRRALTAGATGWLFDAHRPASLMAALNCALAAAEAARPADSAPGHDEDAGPGRTASLGSHQAAVVA